MNFFLEDRAMDFHSLTRRQLQSLCKKNKIPANMTNIAMADALSSLATVEGIEDIGKSMPETPFTTRKTTTARKPVKRQTDSVETSKGVARPSRAPLTEKSSGSEIIIPSTPATRSCRKKATGTLVSRKTVCKIEEDSDVGKEVPVVDHGYSTRRSARLKSGVKVSEYVQKVGGGRNDAVKIEMLSGEETDGDTKSEVTSDVQQKNDVVKIEMVSVEEDNEGIESKPKVTSDVQQKNDSVKIEMLSDEEIKSQSEVTSEAQHKNEGNEVEVLKEEQDDIDSGKQSNTMAFVESLVLEKSRDLIEFPVDDQDATSEDSSSTLIMREVCRDNVAEALDGCTSEVSFAPMISVKEPADIAFYKSSPAEEETEQPKNPNEHQSMVSEGQPMEINEAVEGKGGKDLELKFTDENELSDVKLTEVKSESSEDSNVDEGNCKLTSEVELYNVNVTEACTSGVASSPIVYVEESDIADVLSKCFLMEGSTENHKDKNEDQNMESENQPVEINGVEIGVTHALEFKCTDENANIDAKFTGVEAIYAYGSSPMVEEAENLGNIMEVEVKAAPDLDNESRDVKFAEVEDICPDVSSPMVKETENLEDSNVVVEVKGASDLGLNYVDEDELGDIEVTKVEAIYPDESFPMVDKTENLEDLSVGAEVKAALNFDLKFVDEDELSDVNVTDVEGIYDESSVIEEKTENLDDSSVVVELKATPDLESKFVHQNELSDVKVSEIEATYADESSRMVDKYENLEDPNVVVKVKAAHAVELKFIDENVLRNVKVAEAEAIYANESSSMVEKTENLGNSIIDEMKRTCEASKAEELSFSITFDFESVSCLEAGRCSLEAQQEDPLLVLTEVEGAINDGSEIQMVGLEKSVSISDDLEITAILDDEVNWSCDDETSSYESEEDFDAEAPNSDTIEQMEVNELDVVGCSDVDISNAMEELSISPSVNDPNVNGTAMPVATPTKATASETVARGTTPLKSSTKKKAVTTPKPFMIFSESKEFDENGKLGVRSTSKVAKKVVPEKKENNGDNTVQRKLKATSVRQLKKMIKQLTLKDNKNIIGKEQVHVGKKPAVQHHKNTTVKEEFQVGKRAALQQLSDNCLADEKQK